MKPFGAPSAAREALAEVVGRVSADDVLPVLERYAGWLAGPAVERGLLGPRELGRIWPRHIVNSALLVPLLPDHPTSGSLCDLGSGAGLPGIVLAAARPDLAVVLLEPRQRRAAFLIEVVADLGMRNVDVVRDRAEQYAASSPAHDVVVARAVAPLPTLLTWALPLVRPGGEVLALKGDSAAAEAAQARPAMERAGVVDWQVHTLGDGGNVTHAVRVIRPGRPQAHPVTEDR